MIINDDSRITHTHTTRVEPYTHHPLASRILNYTQTRLHELLFLLPDEVHFIIMETQIIGYNLGNQSHHKRKQNYVQTHTHIHTAN